MDPDLSFQEDLLASARAGSLSEESVAELLAHADFELARSALWGVGEWPSKRGIPFLISLYNDPQSVSWRNDILLRLGFFGAKSFPFLRKIALDRNARTQDRDSACDAIGDAYCFGQRLKTYPQAVAVLPEALRDPSASVRFTACFSLGKIRATAAVPDLRIVAQRDEGRCPYGYVKAQALKSIGVILGGGEDLEGGIYDNWDGDDEAFPSPLA